jgi:hypothetical protein
VNGEVLDRLGPAVVRRRANVDHEPALPDRRFVGIEMESRVLHTRRANGSRRKLSPEIGIHRVAQYFVNPGNVTLAFGF